MIDTLERSADNEVEAPLEQLKQQMDAPVEKRSGGFIAWFTFLLLLALCSGLAALAYYWAWPQWQNMQQQTAFLVQEQQRLNEQSALLQDSRLLLQQDQQQQLSALEQSFLAKQQSLANQNKIQIQALSQKLLERDSAPPRHWVLAEVEYLLQMAGQKVWLEHDYATALALLANADEKLANLEDPSLLIVRQAIANDTQQLASLKKPDTTKVHISLSELRNSVMGLALKHHKVEQEQVLEPSRELANWRSTLNYYWQKSWSSLIKVRSSVPEDYLDVTTEQELMLRVSLNQQLLLADLALIQKQPNVYQAALTQAKEQLTTYFNLDNEQVRHVSQVLGELSVFEFTPASINALTSLHQLQQYQQQLAGSAL